MIDLLIQPKPDYDYNETFNKWQSGLMIARQIQLSIGSIILAAIIVRIIYKRLYVYNTTKLFMFFCICYLIGMAVVLAHIPALTAGKNYYYNQIYEKPQMLEYYIINVLAKMQKQNKMVWCALEAFINLLAYNLGYFFSVLVTYNVFCVINENYRNFMKRVFKMKKVILFLIIIFVLNITPFILALAQTDVKNYYSYSYGPAGFKLQKQGISANLIFYCGICYNPQIISYKVLQILNIYICPLFLFVIHCLIILENRKKTAKILNSQYLNSKQLFIIKSGQISVIVFIIQAFNLIKSSLGMFSWMNYVVMIVLNYIYDLYPFVILYFYLKYTKGKTGLIYGTSTILSEE